MGCGRRSTTNYTGRPIPRDNIDFTLPNKDEILLLEGHYLERCND